MPWGLAATAVVGLAGAAMSGSAAKDAAQTSADAARAGTDAQLQMFNKTQANYAPQIALGQGAANMLGSIYGIGGGSSGGTSAPSGTSAPGGLMSGGASGPGNRLQMGPVNRSTTAASPGASQPNPNYAAFYDTPGYKFSLDQGTQAINKQAAATGGLYSSNTLAAQNNYAQGTASTQYNSYINQLLSMAGLGNAASSGVGSAATATGQGVAGSLQNAGNAQASGILGQSNAFTNALGQGSNLLKGYNSGGGYGGDTSGGSQYNTYTGADGTIGGGQFLADGSYCDYGLKKNIEPYRFNGMSGLQVYDFHYKDQDDVEDKHRGYIAQDVIEKYPDAVRRGPKGFLMVDYSKLPGWDELDAIGKERFNG